MKAILSLTVLILATLLSLLGRQQLTVHGTLLAKQQGPGPRGQTELPQRAT